MAVVADTREVRQELVKVERDRNVKILFACEAGSRAWGFPGKDSDFDIRFVYVRPVSSYLGLYSRRDVIEGRDLNPGKDMDLAGWDIQKALSLAAGSNPALLEWIHGPVPYYEVGEFAPRLREIMKSYSPKALMHHYASMAHNQHKTYLAGTGEKVAYKKYLYAVRPILAVLWMTYNSVEVIRGRIPPVRFEELLAATSNLSGVRDIIPCLEKILAMKKSHAEADEHARFLALDEFIAESVEEIRTMAKSAWDGRSPDMLALEDLCVSTIKTYWG